MALTPAELERCVADLAAAPERWRHLVRHADDARVYEQIVDDEDVNAWVICWSEDQDTGIAVISGQVREDRLRVGDEPRSRVLGAGKVFTVPAVAIHRVLHAGDVPAVTIHAYSPPLVRTGAYRIGPHGELERELLTSEDELRAEPAVT
jgi:hypothetical protein